MLLWVTCWRLQMWTRHLELSWFKCLSYHWFQIFFFRFYILWTSNTSFFCGGFLLLALTFIHEFLWVFESGAPREENQSFLVPLTSVFTTAARVQPTIFPVLETFTPSWITSTTWPFWKSLSSSYSPIFPQTWLKTLHTREAHRRYVLFLPLFISS